MLEYHKDNRFYTEAGDVFGWVLLWLSFFEIRRDFDFGIFVFNSLRSSALHTMQYFVVHPSLSLLLESCIKSFIKYRL